MLVASSECRVDFWKIISKFVLTNHSYAHFVNQTIVRRNRPQNFLSHLNNAHNIPFLGAKVKILSLKLSDLLSSINITWLNYDKFKIFGAVYNLDGVYFLTTLTIYKNDEQNHSSCKFSIYIIHHTASLVKFYIVTDIQTRNSNGTIETHPFNPRSISSINEPLSIVRDKTFDKIAMIMMKHLIQPTLGIL